MKKILFVVLFLPLIIQESFAQNQRSVEKELTITKGIQFTVDPLAETGSPIGELVGDNVDYTLSDASAFYVSKSTVNGTNRVLGTSSKYYKLHLTPKKAGTYTLSYPMKIYENTIYGYAIYRIQYTIKIVDLSKIEMLSTLEMVEGSTYSISISLTPADAVNQMIWSSSNSSVATVANGVISAVGVGSTLITCTADNGVSAQCEVTVNPVLISSVTLDKTETDLIVGEIVQLNATISPDNATTKSVIWSSSNESIAVVNESGQVTAVSAGLCNITATANDGSGVSASCLVNVLGNVLYCEDLGAVPGATINLPILLTNADAIQGFEFKLVLPEGVSVETDGEGKLMATLTDRAATQGLEGAKQSSNTYQFVFTSTNRLLGTSGAVVNIPLVVADNVAVGSYDIVIKDVELVKYDTSAQIHHGDRMAKLTIREMTLGDVNGDGRISVADAISIINYVLGRTPVSFIMQAADVNGDGSISLGDAVATVDIILGGSNNSRTIDIPEMLDPQ